ncbi:MAG TPA: hypothetical protein VMW12_02810 [Candidatus Dormibacteraeota bacterium]|nr:hypothetical protein [Candidatus Dormibacteraeota bacterium]
MPEDLADFIVIEAQSVNPDGQQFIGRHDARTIDGKWWSRAEYDGTARIAFTKKRRERRPEFGISQVLDIFEDKYRTGRQTPKHLKSQSPDGTPIIPFARKRNAAPSKKRRSKRLDFI